MQLDDNLLTLFKQHRIFSELDNDHLATLVKDATVITLGANERLFNQGDSSDCLYLILEGSLYAALQLEDGAHKLIGVIEAGESVGEVGALSTEPRSLTVTASTKAILLKMPAAAFTALCNQFPTMMFATLRPIINRSKNLLNMISGKTQHNVVVVPANDKVNAKLFLTQLLRDNKEFSKAHIRSDRDDITLPKQAKITHENVLQHFYILQSGNSPLAKEAFLQAEAIYVIADDVAETTIDAVLIEKIKANHVRKKSIPILIFLQTVNKKIEGVTAWQSDLKFKFVIPTRLHQVSDFSRCRRFINGKAVGVVFSGGGTRGWAHLGAIKALLEANIPIDMIGGTSAGGVVAACYARTERYEDAYALFSKIVVESENTTTWRGLTWPKISIFSAKKYTTALKENLGNELIENMSLPYFCVSTDLDSGNEAIHQAGSLWEANRASSSIPGIIPPMIINHKMYVDGGLLNNLPVDIMRNMLGQQAKILAVELNSYTTVKRKYEFPPILTFKDMFWYMLGFTRLSYKFPRFIDTFLRGLFLSSTNKSITNSVLATALVNLDLKKYRLLNVNTIQGDALIEVGYEQTLRQVNISKFKSD